MRHEIVNAEPICVIVFNFARKFGIEKERNILRPPRHYDRELGELSVCQVQLHVPKKKGRLSGSKKATKLARCSSSLSRPVLVVVGAVRNGAREDFEDATGKETAI